MTADAGRAGLDADKQALAEQLNEVHTELRAEASAFPERLRRVRPAPGEWCAMELLGHVAEMHYSYVARAENLIASPGAELGRDMESPERVRAIQQGESASLAEALERLDQARLFALGFLERLESHEMTISGVHRALGPMTVREVFAHTIVGHARNHLNQLRATRSALDGTVP